MSDVSDFIEPLCAVLLVIQIELPKFYDSFKKPGGVLGTN